VAMTCVLALLLLAVGTTSTNLEILEPEPDVFSTSIEPEPALAADADTTSSVVENGGTSTSLGETSTSVGVTSTSVGPATSSNTPSPDTSPSATPTSSAPSSGSTTSAASAPTHTIELSVDLSNADSLTTEIKLREKIKQGLQAVVPDAGDSVEVVIDYVQVISVYGDLPTIDVDDIAEAIVNMSSVELDQITVNGQRHSNFLRRLLETATCITTVNNSVGSDIVAELKRIHSTQTADAFTNQLKSINATAYHNVNASLTSAPAIKIEALTNVKGMSAPPSKADIEAQVAIQTGGTVAVKSVTSSGVSSTSTAQGIFEEDHACTVSMMTMWAFAYAFAMN